MHFGDSIFIFLLALVLFGPKKLPEIGRQIGKLLAEFRRASNEFKFQIQEEMRNLEDEERRKKIAEQQAKAAEQRAQAAAAEQQVQALPTAATVGGPTVAGPSDEGPTIQPPTIQPPAIQPPAIQPPTIQPPSTGAPVSTSFGYSYPERVSAPPAPAEADAAGSAEVQVDPAVPTGNAGPSREVVIAPEVSSPIAETAASVDLNTSGNGAHVAVPETAAHEVAHHGRPS